ncbi:methyltransferase [Streptomyces natalensis ATCC 27448]|uniref:Protein-L-isoaspartate O-methyltransferase n=1 Tax=Streptomyces natalensis ATCC 27448 TaxID=1240678 RepID=A0A0D7CJP2_9ACTN|nr:methyltransferase [Streptomyces natalensis ATCC 27448]
MAELTTQLGRPVPAEWAAALRHVPRHRFLPDRIWLRDGHGGYAPCDRSTDPAQWWEAAYSDAPLVTQLHVEDDGYQQPTSSASAPSTVVRMLEAAQISDGHHVLEIGTGTGYHAALLAHRLGDTRVTSIEVDESIANRARANLRAGGQQPTVITGDGAHGHPAGAPYDRAIATCSVRAIPPAWIQQTRPGARIVTPWSTAWITYGTLTLARARDDTVSGRFAPYGAYMVMHGQRPDVELERDLLHDGQVPDRSTTLLSPWDVAGHNLDAQFAIGIRVPDIWHSWDADTAEAHTRLWLADDRATSWAAVDYDGKQTERFRVSQHGPRNLWDEVETAHAQWDQAGRPAIERHGLTATVHGHQLWTDRPENAITT